MAGGRVIRRSRGRYSYTASQNQNGTWAVTAFMASANYGGGSSGYEIQSYTSVKKPPRSPKTVWREAVGSKKALADELRGGTAVLLRLVQIAIGIIMFLVVMVVILAVVLRQG